MLFLLFFCLAVFSLPLYAEDTVAGVESSLKIRSELFQQPASHIPLKVVLDPKPMEPDLRSKYQNIPVSSKTVRWEDTLYLRECIHYLTGFPISEIPNNMELLAEWLPTKGYRIFRAHELQAKALEAVICNNMYVLALMNKRKVEIDGNKTAKERTNKKEKAALKQSENGCDTIWIPFLLYYNIIKGYEIIQRQSPRERNRVSMDVLLYLYNDNKIIAGESDHLEYDYEEMIQVIKDKAEWIDPPHIYREKIQKIFLIVPDTFSKRKMEKHIKTTMENVPLSFKTPEFEELKPRDK